MFLELLHLWYVSKAPAPYDHKSRTQERVAYLFLLHCILRVHAPDSFGDSIVEPHQVIAESTTSGCLEDNF